MRASHVLNSVPGGPTNAIARNQLAIDTSNYSEFTGPAFSPDGKVLFVNIQVPAITLAITGPWQHYLIRVLALWSVDDWTLLRPAASIVSDRVGTSGARVGAAVMAGSTCP